MLELFTLQLGACSSIPKYEGESVAHTRSAAWRVRLTSHTKPEGLPCVLTLTHNISYLGDVGGSNIMHTIAQDTDPLPILYHSITDGPWVNTCA